jgi:hypothetical protein
MSINKKYFNKLALSSVDTSHECTKIWANLSNIGTISGIIREFMREISFLLSALEEFCKDPAFELHSILLRAITSVLCIIRYINFYVIGLNVPGFIMEDFNGILQSMKDELMVPGPITNYICTDGIGFVRSIDVFTEQDWIDTLNLEILTPEVAPQPQPITCPKPTRGDAENILNDILGKTGQVLSDEAREELITAILTVMVAGASLAAIIAAIFASGVAAAELGLFALYSLAAAIWASVQNWCSEEDEGEGKATESLEA